MKAKKTITALLIILAVIFMVSCTTISPVSGATGMVGSKTGEASQSFLGTYPLGAFPLAGEGGILQAAQNGGITKVGTVDLRIDYPASPLIPFCTVTTVVTGE